MRFLRPGASVKTAIAQRAKPLKCWSEKVDVERVDLQLPTAPDRGGSETPDLTLVGPC